MIEKLSDDISAQDIYDFLDRLASRTQTTIVKGELHRTDLEKIEESIKQRFACKSIDVDDLREAVSHIETAIKILDV